MLRQLWTQESVTVDGRFHRITAAGLAPLPVQRPIPIWIGAFAPAALRRVGRIADGWFPMARPGDGLDEALEIVAEGAREVGTRSRHHRLRGPGGLQRRAAPTAWRSTPTRWRAGRGQPRLGQHRCAPAWTGVDAHIAALTAVAALLL